MKKPLILSLAFVSLLCLNFKDMTNVVEIWKPIKDYEGYYEVSNLGRIKSLERVDCKGQSRKEKIKKHGNDKDGYKLTTLCKDRVKTNFRVHRLVALHFVPNPNNKPFINHKDNNPANNLFSNLEWCTAKENTEYCRNQLRHPEFGENHKDAKLTNAQALQIFKMKGKCTEIAKAFNVSPLIVSRIKIGYTYFNITGKQYEKRKK